jgi:hypothetical protein
MPYLPLGLIGLDKEYSFIKNLHMRNNVENAADVQGLAAKSKKKKVSIELMRDFMAHIASLLRYKGRSAYSHSVEVPTKLLDGIDELSCTLDYPLDEPHTFNIPLDRESLAMSLSLMWTLSVWLWQRNMPCSKRLKDWSFTPFQTFGLRA